MVPLSARVARVQPLPAGGVIAVPLPPRTATMATSRLPPAVAADQLVATEVSPLFAEVAYCTRVTAKAGAESTLVASAAPRTIPRRVARRRAVARRRKASTAAAI